MNAFWPDFSYDMYRKACVELNYPEEPFSRYIKEFIKPEDVVLDIGSGIGIPAVYISRLCKKVIAVEQNKPALDYFDKEIKRGNIKNIQTVHGKWPDVDVDTCDAAVAFYAGGITRDIGSLILLINSVRRGGIITSYGTQQDGGFYKSLADRLGVKSREHSCDNGCYLKGRLEMLDCRVKCEQINHDFGQPVNDIDEAARFLSWQLQLDEGYIDGIKEIAMDYITFRNGKMYIPNQRSTCVIIFEK